MLRFSFNSVADWQAAVENFRIDASQNPFRIADGVTPLDLVDDFNDGVFGPPWEDSTDIGDFGEAPIETGGFLQFDYPAPSGQKRMEVALNSPRGGMECETRFIWDSLGSGNSGAHANEWGVALLQGTFIDPPMTSTDFNNRLLWELTFAPTPTSNILHILPVMVDATGQKMAYDAGVWKTFPGLGIFGFPINPSSPMSGIPVTFTVTKGPAGGLIMKAIRNDDPGQVIFETTESPPLRTLSGDIYLDIARSLFMNSSRFRFDYFKLSGQPIEPPTGFLRLRKTFEKRVKASQFSLSSDPQGGTVEVQFRAGDTETEVDGAAFSAPITTTSGPVSAPTGKIIEAKIALTRASPSPTVSGLSVDYVYEAVAEDRPLILSLNEAHRKAGFDSGSNNALAPLVGDGDPDTQWESGFFQSFDGPSAGVRVIFLDATSFGEERMIDTVILQNTNFRNSRIILFDINQQIIKDMTLEFISPDVLVTFDPVSAAGVVVSATTTQGGSQAKRLGEVYAGVILSALPNFDKYEPARGLHESGRLRTLGGRLVSFRGPDKYASRWAVSLVDQEAKDTLEAVFVEHPLVTFYPEPDFRPRELFDVSWEMGELGFPYSESVKPAGHTIQADMAEI